MADNSFHTTVESLFKGMDSFITTKTVVGDAIHIGDTIILPLVDVSFGVAAGAFSQEKKNNGAGGMGGKIMPSAVLVIQNGTTKLVNIKNQDGITKILDMVPDFVNKFTSKNDVVSEDSAADQTDDAAKSAAGKEMEDILKDSANKSFFKTVQKRKRNAYIISNICVSLLESAMKRMLGFALFCFAMGMLVMIVIHNRFCGFVLMILCMLAGYYLFCCDDC